MVDKKIATGSKLVEMYHLTRGSYGTVVVDCPGWACPLFVDQRGGRGEKKRESEDATDGLLDGKGEKKAIRGKNTIVEKEI